MASVDPHISKVATLLKFEGEEGSTEIVDSVAGINWQCYGSAKIVAAGARYGEFGLETGNGVIYAPGASAPILAAKDFAIDFSVKFKNVTTAGQSGYQGLFGQWGGASGRSWIIYFQQGTAHKILFQHSTTGSNNIGVEFPLPANVSAGVYQDFSLRRNGTLLALFWNNELVGSVPFSATIYTSSNHVYVGAAGNSAVFGDFYARADNYFDEIRVTVDEGRGNTPYPPGEFPVTDTLGGTYGEINGTVAISVTPAERDLIAISYAKQLVDDGEGGTVERRLVVGETRSAPDGSYTLQTPNFTDEVIVLALDNYGEAWRPHRDYTVGQRIRPTKGNETGYGYDITIAGNSGETEPTWWVPAGGSDTGQIGTATAQARPLWWSVAHAPVQPEVVEPEEPAP